MSVQSGINQAIGSVGATLAIGSHLAEQEKQNKVAKIEAEQEVKNAELAKDKANLELQGEILKNPRVDSEGNPITDPEKYQATILNEKLQNLATEANDYRLRYNENPEVQHGSKRLDKAQEAFLNYTDEINARRNLQFNLEKAQEKLKALGGNK